MAEWIEIPAQRVLVVGAAELMTEFEMLDENGVVLESPELQSPALYRRKRDRRLFRYATWQRGLGRWTRGEISLSEV